MLKIVKPLKTPCGCIMGSDGEFFFVKPCSLTCENYLYAKSESERLGNRLMFVKVVKPKQ